MSEIDRKKKELKERGKRVHDAFGLDSTILINRSVTILHYQYQFWDIESRYLQSEI